MNVKFEGRERTFGSGKPMTRTEAQCREDLQRDALLSAEAVQESDPWVPDDRRRRCGPETHGNDGQ